MSTQTDPETPIRQLAESLAEAVDRGDYIRPREWHITRDEAMSDLTNLIEAALLQVQRETREACAKEAEDAIEPHEHPYFHDAGKRIAATLRAQAEGDRP